MSCGVSNKCTMKLWGTSENSQQPFSAIERDWKDYSSETMDDLQLENKGNRWSALCSSQPLHSQKFPCFLPTPVWFIHTLSLFRPKPSRRRQFKGSTDQIFLGYELMTTQRTKPSGSFGECIYQIHFTASWDPRRYHNEGRRLRQVRTKEQGSLFCKASLKAPLCWS